MLNLLSYPGNFGEPSDSAFCVKVMCLLEMAGQPWTANYSSDPRQAPKKKLPVLRNGRELIPDSDQIRDYLEKTYAVDFDEGLDVAQRATSRAVIRMMEEHSYFAIVCDRWLIDANWLHIRKAYFGHLSFPLSGLAARQVRKQVTAMLMGQGMARHTPKERLERVKKDILAIEAILGDRPLLFGDKASAADASVVPMLRAMIVTPEATELSDFVSNRPFLMQYLERGKQAMYPKAALALAA